MILLMKKQKLPRQEFANQQRQTCVKRGWRKKVTYEKGLSWKNQIEFCNKLSWRMRKCLL